MSGGAFVNRKFSINRNTGVPRPARRFSIGEPNNATGECPTANHLKHAEKPKPSVLAVSAVGERHRQLPLLYLLCPTPTESVANRPFLLYNTRAQFQDPPTVPSCPRVSTSSHTHIKYETFLPGSDRVHARALANPACHTLQGTSAPCWSRPIEVVYRCRLVHGASERIRFPRGA